MTTGIMRLSTLFASTLLAVTSATEDFSPALSVGFNKNDAALKLKIQFDRWLHRHSKLYTTKEKYSERLSVFARNDDVVSQHNCHYRLGYTSYAMSINSPFADLTDEEFENLYLMDQQNCSATHISSGSVPRSRYVNHLLSTHFFCLSLLLWMHPFFLRILL